MKKVIALIVVALAAIFFCAGCGTPQTIEDQASTQTVPNPWNGTYQGIEAETGKVGFIATISEERIDIQWAVAENQTPVYWSGTFPWKFDSTQITSEADIPIMQSSPLASQDTTKLFTYEDNSWTFNVTVLNVTKTFYLRNL